MQCVKTVVIEMEETNSEEEAAGTALDESFFGYDNKEVLTCVRIDDENLESCKRHAEEVLDL